MEDCIYWEQQDSDMLCAVNALNSLLQGPHWNAVSLAAVSQELDTEENQLITGDSQFSSANVGESGYFSVQALQRALAAYGLTCDYYNAEMKRGQDPVNEKAFICNRHDHWFTLRKIGDTWYNLNSLNDQPGPERVGEFYLSALLDNIQSDGYTIFVVRGEFPDSNKDFWPGAEENQFWVPKSLLEVKVRDNQDDIAKAIEESLKNAEDVDPELEWAIQESMRIEQEMISEESLKMDEEIEPLKEYDGENTFIMRLRLPNGKFETKKFLPDCLLQEVKDWGKFLTKKDVQLVESYPRKVLTDLSQSLSSSGFGPQNNTLILEHI